MENPVVEPKPKKTGAIIGTIVAVLLCGCPGLALCGASAYAATGSFPYTMTVNGQSSAGVMPAWWGFAGLCVSVFLVLIPVVVGILTLRTKKPKAPKDAVVLPPQEPLPPAS